MSGRSTILAIGCLFLLAYAATQHGACTILMVYMGAMP